MADLHLLSRLAGLLALLPALTGQALEISPLTVTLPAGERAGELWLHNDSAEPWHGQARLYRWEQTLDDEQLQPAVDLAVSPGELHLAPHARQRVRLVALGGATDTEQSYRLVLRAGPQSPPQQVSLPVFRSGAQARRGPALTARLLAGSDPAVLELYNGGHQHARLADLAWVVGTAPPAALLPGLAGYVLAGQTRRWTLPGPAQAYGDGRFSARIGDAEAALLDLPDPPIAPDTAPGL